MIFNQVKRRIETCLIVPWNIRSMIGRRKNIIIDWSINVSKIQCLAMTVFISCAVLIPRNTQSKVRLPPKEMLIWGSCTKRSWPRCFCSKHAMFFYGFSGLNYCTIQEKFIISPTLLCSFGELDNYPAEKLFANCHRTPKTTAQCRLIQPWITPHEVNGRNSWCHSRCSKSIWHMISLAFRALL